MLAEQYWEENKSIEKQLVLCMDSHLIIIQD